MFEPGDVVVITYAGYYVIAEVIEPERESYMASSDGWVTVMQLIDSQHGWDYWGATYEAAVDYVRPVGELAAPETIWQSRLAATRQDA